MLSYLITWLVGLNKCASCTSWNISTTNESNKQTDKTESSLILPKVPKQKMEIQQARGRRGLGRKGHLHRLCPNSLPRATKGVWVQGGEKSSLHHPVISWATHTRNQMVSDPLGAPERTGKGCWGRARVGAAEEGSEGRLQVSLNREDQNRRDQPGGTPSGGWQREEQQCLTGCWRDSGKACEPRRGARPPSRVGRSCTDRLRASYNEGLRVFPLEGC